MSIREKNSDGFFILQKGEFDCFNYYYGLALKYSPRVITNQRLLNVIKLIKRKQS